MCVHAYLIYTAGCIWSLSCLGSTMHLLHRSRWLSLQAGKLWCAMRAVWHSYWGKLLIFLFIHNQMYGYQECRAFTRVLLIPWEVVKFTPLTTTVLNGNFPFLDCPWLRALFEIESKDKSLFLHGCGCEENAVPIIKLEVFYMRENKEQLWERKVL